MALATMFVLIPSMQIQLLIYVYKYVHLVILHKMVPVSLIAIVPYLQILSLNNVSVYVLLITTPILLPINVDKIVNHITNILQINLV